MASASQSGGGSPSTRGRATRPTRVQPLTKEDRSSWEWSHKSSALKRSQWLQNLRRWASPLFEGVFFTSVIVIATLFALFWNDLRIVFFPPAYDDAAAVVNYCLVVDTFLACLLRKRFFLSFFYFVDAISIINLLWEVPQASLFTYNLIFGKHLGSWTGASILDRVPYDSFYVFLLAMCQSLLITRAVRLVRVQRIYQQYQAAKEQRKLEKATGMRLAKLSSPAWWQKKGESRVGRSFMVANARYIVLLTVLLCLVIPALQLQSPYKFTARTTFAEGGLSTLHNFWLKTPDKNSTAIRKAVGYYTVLATQEVLGRDTSNVLGLILCNTTVYLPGSLVDLDLRPTEVSIYQRSTDSCNSPDNANCLQSTVVLNMRWRAQANGLLSLARTCFLLAFLVAHFTGFTASALVWVLRPVDDMLTLVREVANNPLAAHARSRDKDKQQQKKQKKGSLETQLLNQTLRKIASLLVVVWGEAGAEIITHNLQDDGQLDPVVPGLRVTAIYGFCDIRRFTDATEVLHTDIMEYVNTVASVVHLETVLHGGAPNKNVGDAFLLVWKFGKDFRHSIQAPSLTQAPNLPEELPLSEGLGAHREEPSTTKPWQPALSSLVSGIEPPAGANSSSRRESLLGGQSEQAGGSGRPNLEPFNNRPNLEAKSPSSQITSSFSSAAQASVEPQRAFRMPFSARCSAIQTAQVWDQRQGRRQSRYPSSALVEPEAVGPPKFKHSQASFLPVPSSLAEAHELADRALATAVIVQAALKRSPRLQQFCERADIQERMPGFEVKLGFGLHVGWAIEGAIGSEYKIDVSYLSSHVNLASRLEAATKQYGVSILMNGDFASLLSPAVQERVRQIDCVLPKGSSQPLGLFTYDLSLDAVPVPTTAEDEETATYSKRHYMQEFADHPDLSTTWAADEAFLARFEEGFEAFVSGRWQAAQPILEETLGWRRDREGVASRDGPSSALLEHMRETGFVAPSDWQGCRPFVEK